MSFIPYGRQSIGESDIAAVMEVMLADYLTQGPVAERFEAALCEAVDAPHCVAVNSATAALHLACRALGVGAGDAVWTSPISFVASSNCALYCGATVDFVDIDPATLNMSVARLEEKLLEAQACGRLPKVVIPVHFSGLPCDMAAIGALARRFGFKVIEDASHAIGGRYGNRAIGTCEHSDVTVFSFHPVKIITTGEGGCAITRDGELAHRMVMLRSHGITRDEARMTGPSHGPWYYQQLDLGFNYRITEMQAALGLSQLRRLDEFVARRHRVADRYDAALARMPLDLPVRGPESYSGMHLYVVRLQLDRIEATHREVFEGLRERGFGVNLHYIPIYLQPFYERMGFRPGLCPEAERYYARAVSIPLYPDLTDDQQDRVVRALDELVR